MHRWLHCWIGCLALALARMADGRLRCMRHNHACAPHITLVHRMCIWGTHRGAGYPGVAGTEAMRLGSADVRSWRCTLSCGSAECRSRKHPPVRIAGEKAEACVKPLQFRTGYKNARGARLSLRFLGGSSSAGQPASGRFLSGGFLPKVKIHGLNRK